MRNLALAAALCWSIAIVAGEGHFEQGRHRRHEAIARGVPSATRSLPTANLLQTPSSTPLSIPTPTLAKRDDNLVPIPTVSVPKSLSIPPHKSFHSPVSIPAFAETTTTTTSTSPVCAPSYSAATMITGTGTLPKPTSFVKRRSLGTQDLILDGAPFRIVGPNIYWLCQDENVLPVGYYTDKGRVREALAIAVAMGATTIRATSCSVSLGSVYSLLPVFNHLYGSKEIQWDIHDYVIYAAGQYGLRMIMPLTDDYDYYTGGKYTFLRFRNVSTADYGAAFYTNKGILINYRSYIQTLLTHKNPYTGLMWGQDPTILAWETGNELGAYIGKEGYPPGKWTEQVTETIRIYSTNQLIIDGSDGFYNYSTKAVADGIGIKNIAIMSDHSYPRNIALLKAEVPLLQTSGRQKNFLIGEYDWTNPGYGDTLTNYLSYLEGVGNYMGDMIWNVMGHDANCCAYVQHNDGYSAYYPNGNTPDLMTNLKQVVQHWYRVTGRQIPNDLPGVLCPQPVF